MKGAFLKALVVACLASLCLAVGPFDLPNDTSISPRPTYRIDGKNTSFVEGDILRATGGLAADAATVGNPWKDARIPYVIDCSIKNIVSAITSLNEAIEAWERKTCIRFVKREPSDEHFVTFFRSSGCWASDVGYRRKSSEVSIGYGCEYTHVMIHELGHVIGFWHEQSRPDRDKYVSIVPSNIVRELLYNFNKVTEKTQSHGEEYDYGSIMHYPFNAFAVNRDYQTLVPLQKVTEQPYVKLSDSDIRQANEMYKCGSTAGSAKVQGSKIRERRAQEDECVDEHHHCAVWAQYNHCDTNPEPLLLFCKKSCDNCGPCVNEASSCPKQFDYDRCIRNARFALRKCKAACEVCQPEATVRPPTNSPPTTSPPTNPPPTTSPPTNSPPTTSPPTNTTSPPTPPTLRPTVIIDKIPVITDPPIGEILPGKLKYIGVICIDRDKLCPVWKDDGRCERDDWVKANCLVSCNRVDICDMQPLQPTGSCATSLGLSAAYKDVKTLPGKSFKASSFFNPGGRWGAYSRAARLYLTDDHTVQEVGAWCANPQYAKDSWLEIDLLAVKRVTGVATQGRDVYFEHVRSYEISYKQRINDEWQSYSVSGETKVLTANCDHFTPVFNILENPITAQFIRLLPKTYRGTACLRVELFGCDA